MSVSSIGPRAAREPYVGTEEVAEFLGKPASWVYDRAGQLGIPRYKVGSHYRYRLSEVEAWVRDQDQ